jgi:hypothetical protein
VYVSTKVSGQDTRENTGNCDFKICIYCGNNSTGPKWERRRLVSPHGLQLSEEAGVRSVIARPFTERGQVTRKIVPAPDVRSTVTVPPWS